MKTQKVTELKNLLRFSYLKSVIAHRLSYYFKLNGPTYVIDTACSSSMNALEHAFKSLRKGECDHAIVGGTNLILHPGSTLQFFRYDSQKKHLND